METLSTEQRKAVHKAYENIRVKRSIEESITFVSVRFARPGYYVSVIDGPRKAILAGPFKTHKEALAAVEPTKEAWWDLDPRAAFAAWGTCGIGVPNPEAV